MNPTKYVFSLALGEDQRAEEGRGVADGGHANSDRRARERGGGARGAAAPARGPGEAQFQRGVGGWRGRGRAAPRRAHPAAARAQRRRGRAPRQEARRAPRLLQEGRDARPHRHTRPAGQGGGRGHAAAQAARGGRGQDGAGDRRGRARPLAHHRRPGQGARQDPGALQGRDQVRRPQQ